MAEPYQSFRSVQFWHGYPRFFSTGNDFIADPNYIGSLIALALPYWISGFTIIAVFLLVVLLRFTYRRPRTRIQTIYHKVGSYEGDSKSTVMESAFRVTSVTCKTFLVPFFVSLLTLVSFGAIALALTANSRLREILDMIFNTVDTFVDTIVGLVTTVALIIFGLYEAVKDYRLTMIAVGFAQDQIEASDAASLWLTTFLQYAEDLSEYLSDLIDNLRSILNITSAVSTAAFIIIALGLLVIALGPVFLFLQAQLKSVHQARRIFLLVIIALPVLLSLFLTGAVVIGAVGMADSCILLEDTYNAILFGGNTSATEEGWSCPIDIPGSEYLEAIRFFQVFGDVFERKCLNGTDSGGLFGRYALREASAFEWIRDGNEVPKSARDIQKSIASHRRMSVHMGVADRSLGEQLSPNPGNGRRAPLLLYEFRQEADNVTDDEKDDILGIIAGALNLTACDVAGAMVDLYDTAVEGTLVNCTLIAATTTVLLNIVCGQHGAVQSLTVLYGSSLICVIVLSVMYFVSLYWLESVATLFFYANMTNSYLLDQLAKIDDSRIVAYFNQK